MGAILNVLKTNVAMDATAVNRLTIVPVRSKTGCKYGSNKLFFLKRKIVDPFLCHKLFLLCDMKRLGICLDVCVDCVSHVDVPVLCLFARGVCFVLYVHVSSCEMYNNDSFFSNV